MIAIALHGGAGDRSKETVREALELEYTESMNHALDVGYDILTRGGSSLDAVEQSIRILEDAPCFNAGRGAALNDRGEAELDAGICDGNFQRVGAVAGVRTIRNPISAARVVMEHTAHVLIIGEGAEELARQHKLDIVSNDYFITDEVRAKFNRDTAQRDTSSTNEKVTLGTVGCVALDLHGNVCSGNSTGGIMHKHRGRVGDAAMNGAGMAAHNTIAAIACTGYGEYFVRVVAAQECIARMRYAQLTLEEAMDSVLLDVQERGGRGGMIGVDARGVVYMPFNTTSMVRGMANGVGERGVWVW